MSNNSVDNNVPDDSNDSDENSNDSNENSDDSIGSNDSWENDVRMLYYKRKAALDLMSYDLTNVKYKKPFKPKCTSILYQPVKRFECNSKLPMLMTTETLEEIMKQKKAKEKMKVKQKLRRRRKINQILKKIENEFRESAMSDLVSKFANYLAKTCIKKHLPSVMTESAQRMLHGLVCNMYMSLGIKGNNATAAIDKSVFETVAYVLVNMIIEAQFQTRFIGKNPNNLEKLEFAENDGFGDSENLEKCLRKRAKHGTKRKKRSQNKIYIKNEKTKKL